MEISQLAALRAIAETGSFTEAAARLHQTQSALSHKIRNLEDELGEALLIRARPKVYPTRAGELVLSASNRVLSEISALLEHFPHQRRGPAAGSIRIAATNLGIVYLFGELCEAFANRFPHIELNFKATETPDEAVRRVVAGAADVAFGPLPPDDAQLTAVPLGATEHVFVVTCEHPLAQAETVTIEDIRAWPFIRFDIGSGSRTVSDAVFARYGGYPPVVMESNDVEFVKRMAAAGSGAALLPAFALRRHHESGRLSVLRVRDELPWTVAFGLCYRSNVQRRSVDSLANLCMEMRGPEPRRITADNAGVAPFASSMAT